MELKSTQVGRTSEQFPVGMRVLAVDNNPTCLQTLEELLIHCNYHVTRTTESKKALEMLREKSNMFDLVITEVEMPETDGFKLLEIGLAMDLPVILLSAHRDYDSLNKGIIHGACDYLVKPVGLKELQNIWRHVVKKNISSYAENIGPSEYHLVPSDGKRQNEDDSDRKEEDGDGDNKHNGMKSCIRMKRVVWKQELHQKFLDAIQQLGDVDKALPKQMHALMNVEGLTRFNVASHLQKYRLSLKRATKAYKLNMPQVDGFGKCNATRQMPSLELLSRSHLPQTPSTNLQGMNSSRFIQQGYNQKNSSNSANPSGTYQHTPLPRVENVNLFQPTSSPLKPLLFPKSNFSAYKEDIKNIKNPAIVGSSLDSSMSRNSFQTACKLPNIPTVTKSDPSTGSCIIQIMTEPCYRKAARRHRFFIPLLLAAAMALSIFSWFLINM